MYRWLWNISEDEDSAAFLGNLCQSSLKSLNLKKKVFPSVHMEPWTFQFGAIACCHVTENH